MKGPGFQVVSGVVVVLAGVALAVKLLAPLLPPPPENSMASEPAEFLKAGGRQQIDWRHPEPAAFAESRRTQKPVFLLVGVAWDDRSRAFDRNVLDDPEVQEMLNREFVCVRVDASERPYWAQAFLPVSRAGLGFCPWLQAWLIDPNGRVFGALDISDPAMNEAPALIERLNRHRDQYEAMLEGRPGLPVPGSLHRTDLAAIGSTPEALPTTADLFRLVLANGNLETGGFPVAGRQELRPMAYRLLALMGRTDALRTYLDPVLSTAAVDWLDGGFFSGAAREDWRGVSGDKLAVQNAEMLGALALAAQHDPLYRYLAEQTARSLTTEFLHGGLAAPARMARGSVAKRDRRLSFDPNAFRPVFGEGFLNAEDLEWSRQNLGLRPDANASMRIRATEPRRLVATQQRRLDEVLQRLRAAPGRPGPSLAAQPNLEVSATVAARLFEASRLLDRRDWSDAAAGVVDRVSRFSSGDDLTHTLEGHRPLYLGDYLAVADAYLQEYLATGRLQSLESGTQVMRRARSLFSLTKSGVWATVRLDRPEDWPEDLATPEIVDNFGEACESKAIRLLQAYGVILGGAEGDLMIAGARKKALAYIALPERLGFYGAGYFCALWGNGLPYALAVGPGAVADATATARLAPGALAAPIVGDLRPKLQQLDPGVYVVDGPVRTGPLSPARAAELLGPPSR